MATTPISAGTLCTTTPTTPPAPTTSRETTAVVACTVAATNSGFLCRSRLHFFKRGEELILLLHFSFFLPVRKIFASYLAFVICLHLITGVFLITTLLFLRDDLTIAILAAGKKLWEALWVGTGLGRSVFLMLHLHIRACMITP